jgi:hypothetical protein
VIPALPMEHQAYGLAFTRGDDLFQGDTKKAFLVLRQTMRMVPEYEWALATLLQRPELGFTLCLRGQRLVLAAFQLRRHEPIRRIHCIVLAPGECHFIARVL